MDPDLIFRLSEAVDRLVGVDIAGRGISGSLYAAARERQGGRPLVLTAAEVLRGAVREGRPVSIATGFVIPGSDCRGETDGPTGAAILARAIALAWNVPSVILVQQEIAGIVTAALTAAGVRVATEA